MVAGPRVFITYRREETGAHAGRLYDALAARFAEDNVFMDVDLAPGVDFVERIGEAVGACDVLIVVMGPDWATVTDESGRARLADPEDFVRLEVETALRRPEVTPIPVLVAGAKMPDRDELPPEIQAITRRNALELSDLRWRQDVGRLISTLDELLSEMRPVPGPLSPVPGGAAEKTVPANGQPETASLSTDASRKPVVKGWVRRHLPITIAVAVIAVAVIAVAILALGGGSTPVTEAGLPEAIPADIPGCHMQPPNPVLRESGADKGAGLEYRCGFPNVENASLSYLQFPDAQAASAALASATASLRSRDFALCHLNASEAIHSLYSDGRADCLVSQSQGVIINWNIDEHRSPVVGSAAFDPGIGKERAFSEWKGVIQPN